MGSFWRGASTDARPCCLMTSLAWQLLDAFQASLKSKQLRDEGKLSGNEKGQTVADHFRYARTHDRDSILWQAVRNKSWIF